MPDTFTKLTRTQTTQALPLCVKTLEQLIWDLTFLNAAAFVAHPVSLQNITSYIFGIKVSLKKTEVLNQSVPREQYRPPYIIIAENELKVVHLFT